MDLSAFHYADLQMLSEALTQYVDNDADVQALREERGEPDPDAVGRARAMRDRVDQRILEVLQVGADPAAAVQASFGCDWCGRNRALPCRNTRDLQDAAISGDEACFRALERAGGGEAGMRYVTLNRDAVAAQRKRPSDPFRYES